MCISCVFSNYASIGIKYPFRVCMSQKLEPKLGHYLHFCIHNFCNFCSFVKHFVLIFCTFEMRFQWYIIRLIDIHKSKVRTKNRPLLAFKSLKLILNPTFFQGKLAWILWRRFLRESLRFLVEADHNLVSQLFLLQI